MGTELLLVQWDPSVFGVGATTSFDTTSLGPRAMARLRLVVNCLVSAGYDISKASAATIGQWALLLGKLIVIGPAIGFTVGALGAWLMTQVDRRFEIRREYQALFGMGLVFTSYTAAVAAVIAAGIIPAGMEMMDKPATHAVVSVSWPNAMAAFTTRIRCRSG